MKVTKFKYYNQILLYLEEKDLKTFFIVDNERQMRRLGECLIELEKTGSREVNIEPIK